MQKKFLVTPWEIKSEYDGQMHYISAEQLIRLYGVDRDECIVIREVPVKVVGILNGEEYIHIKKELDYRGLDRSQYIQLHPRRDGNYSLEQAMKEQGRCPKVTLSEFEETQKEVPAYIRELMNKIGESFAINPDFAIKMRREQALRTATEVNLKMHNDLLDALAYSQDIYKAFHGATVPRAQLIKKVLLDDFWLSGEECLERQLKNTTGKARRKIRRKIKKLKRREKCQKTKQLQQQKP